MAYLKWSKAVSGFTLAALIALLIGRGCSKQQTSEMSPVLKEGEREKIVIDFKAGKVERTSHRGLLGGKDRIFGDSRGEVHAVDKGVRKASITVKEDGKVEVKTQTNGWIFEPGLCAVFGDKPRFGIDAQLWYWKSFGVVSGITATTHWQMRGVIAGSYNFYSNTSLVVGVDSSKEFNVGVRIAL